MYRIVFTRQAERALLKMPRQAAEQVRQKLLRLAENPYAPTNNATRLQGRTGYRLRIGDWRVIYEVEDDVLRILVLKIGKRGDIYR
jgi:mRNA interferase RelE/StbE